MMLPVLAGVFAGMQMADLTTALVMLDQLGTSVELNPIAVALYEAHGPAGLSLLKLAAILLGLVSFVWLGLYRRRTAALLLWAGAIIGGVGALSNVLTVQ